MQIYNMEMYILQKVKYEYIIGNKLRFTHVNRS